MDTLYFDGKCGTCVREASLLTRFKRPGLQLLDLHSAPVTPGSPPMLLRKTTLHLQTSAGEWLTGVDALTRAWSHTPFWWLFSMLRWPLLGPLIDACYAQWARRRYRRLYGCSDCRPEEG
jgi:predicted DCC family thiol-disulfide oxidoreductase YuxK